MLKGTLDDFTLPDIIRLLSQAKKTGSLEVERSAGRGTVYFREGDVYFAESSLSKELLGQKLVKSGVITSNQLMKALDEQASAGGRLGGVLLSSGLVFEDQLETAVRSQIEDAVFDLLRWELGEFSWSAGAAVAPEVSLSVSVENLIMEASRRLDELEVIKRKIPSEHTVLNMAPTPPEGAVEINITPDEWRVMVLVNGSRSVLEIAETVGLDVFQAMRTLYGLVSAGLVEVPGALDQHVDEVDLPLVQVGEPDVEAAEAVEVADEPVDAFDAPGPGDLTTEVPSDASSLSDGDPFASEILSPEETSVPLDILPSADATSEADVSELDQPIASVTDIPVTAEPDDVPSVDKSAAVRELSNLFKQNTEVDSSPTFLVPPLENKVEEATGDAPEAKKRVEDDEEITRGLISRLIDGVKGL